MKRPFLILTILLTLGCSSSFETVQPDGQKFEGIYYYQPQLVKVTFEFSQLTDKDGRLVPPKDPGKPACQPIIQKEEITTLPDYSKPYKLLNKTSAFSSGKLAVTLTNGMITAINSESTPQLPQLLGTVAQLAVKALDLPRTTPGTEGLQPCNAAPRIVGITKVEIK